MYFLLIKNFFLRLARRLSRRSVCHPKRKRKPSSVSLNRSYHEIRVDRSLNWTTMKSIYPHPHPTNHYFDSKFLWPGKTVRLTVKSRFRIWSIPRSRFKCRAICGSEFGPMCCTTFIRYRFRFWCTKKCLASGWKYHVRMVSDHVRIATCAPNGQCRHLARTYIRPMEFHAHARSKPASIIFRSANCFRSKKERCRHGLRKATTKSSLESIRPMPWQLGCVSQLTWQFKLINLIKSNQSIEITFCPNRLVRVHCSSHFHFISSLLNYRWSIQPTSQSTS